MAYKVVCYVNNGNTCIKFPCNKLKKAIKKAHDVIRTYNTNNSKWYVYDKEFRLITCGCYTNNKWYRDLIRDIIFTQ